MPLALSELAIYHASWAALRLRFQRASSILATLSPTLVMLPFSTTTASAMAPGRPMRPAEHQSGSYGWGNGRYCPTAGLASTATVRVSLIGHLLPKFGIGPGA